MKQIKRLREKRIECQAITFLKCSIQYCTKKSVFLQHGMTALLLIQKSNLEIFVFKSSNLLIRKSLYVYISF